MNGNCGGQGAAEIVFLTEPEEANPVANAHTVAIGSRLPGFVPFPSGSLGNPRKTYYKCELARLYGCSLRTLSNWINRWPREFARTGYRKSDKQLTPRQVRLLFSLVGEPEG